jgi:hypothetical protein
MYNLPLSRDEAVRIRFALHSAALAMTSKPEAETPGSRIANEIHAVNSILSRFIALIESTSEGTEFEIIPKASQGARRSHAATNRLPGLGGESYAGQRRKEETGSVQPEPSSAREVDGASVSETK